jgi:hypothetical protein
MARINPQLQQDQQALQARLANQGLQPGSQAYNDAYDSFTRQSNDARYGAILGAGEEQSRLAGLDQARAQFGNDAQAQQFQQMIARAGFGNASRQQNYDNSTARTAFNNDVRQQQFGNDQSRRGSWMNEQYAQRNQPINEIAALLGTGGVQQPNFAPQQGGGIANTDFAGLQQQAYANKLAGYQSKQQMMGGLFGGIAGAIPGL